MSTIYLSSLYNYSANITAYDPVTKLVTLDAPVNLSLGVNSFIGGDVSSHYSIVGNYSKIDSVVQSNSRPAKPTTDESGNYVGIFNVPSTKFQTGSRIFSVDNRTNPSDRSSATTFAEATFTASGLSVKNQTQFFPSVDSSVSTFTQVNQISNQLVGTSSSSTSTTVTVVPPTPTPQETTFPAPSLRNGGNGGSFDPVAQTFIISTDNYPNGVFLYSIKLFFQNKPSTNIPISLWIVPTLNGYPSGETVPHSKVILYPNEVKVSSTPHYLDPSASTEFVFECPVYIKPGELYAFIVKSSSVDYYLYYGEQNKIALKSTSKANYTDDTPTSASKITAAPYVGALFESQNGITWTADQTKDLMFVINKCVFSTGTISVPFTVPKNLPYRKLGTQDIGNKIDANSVTQMFGNYSPDRLYDAINVTTTEFVPTGTTINYSYATTLGSNYSTTNYSSISPGRLGSPTPDDVYLNDGQGERILSRSLNNSFSLLASLSSSDRNLTPIISDDGISLYTITYAINNMGLSNNIISVTNSGNGYSSLSSANITVSAPDTGSSVAVLGLTANATGAISSVYVISPGAGYLKTPTITITGANSSPAVISVSGETSPKGGNSFAKYFTKKVVLAPGNDSGDLRVFYTAYRPPGTNIYVYYKILSSLDTTPFDSIGWQLMTTINNQNTFSTSRDDLYEFEAAPGIFANNLANNVISYTNPSGQSFSTFIQFAIKVVLATSENTVVPYLTDIRALALPPGTGF
jgi:hypothetical protein